jgi:hypothetical protein
VDQSDYLALARACPAEASRWDADFPVAFLLRGVIPVDVLPRSIAAGSFAMPPVFL